MRRLRGSIQKLGKDRWRVFATVRDDEGHPRKLTATVAGSRMDAEAELERLLGTEGMRRDRPFSEVVASRRRSGAWRTARWRSRP